METVLYATFARAEDGVRAVESLLHHGVRAEDISLSLPQRVGAAPTVMASNVVGPTASPRSVPVGHCHEAVLDAEEGAGLGLGLGLVAASCVPGIGLIAGSEMIVAGLVAAGVVIGGLTGGIYGYLLDRGIDHEVVRKMSDCLTTDRATLSVTVSGAANEAEIADILEGFGGRLISQPAHP